MTQVVETSDTVRVLVSGARGLAGLTGAAGGNVMAIGLFSVADGMVIDAGTARVRTSGHSVAGSGAADYTYDAAVDAAFVVANPRVAFLADDGRGFRLDHEQPLSVTQFGVGAGALAAANGAAFEAAVAYLKSIAGNVSTNGFYKGSPRLRVPAGAFALDRTIDITHTLILEGEGTGQAGGRASKLSWPAGVTGIRVQRYDTSGPDTVDGATHFGGDGSTIRGLYLVGGYVATEGEFHGVHLRARATIDDCVIEGFEGDGIHVNADQLAAGADHGNANCLEISRCSIFTCRNGVYTNGGDANAGAIYRVDTSANRRWGVWDSSFLGNWLAACHSDGNGISETVSPNSVVSHGGNRYSVVVDQEAWASVNAPSGTTADNTGWLYMAAGGVNAPLNIDAWTNGITLRSAGSYRCDGINERSTFSGCYAEGGQGWNQFTASTLVVGGMGLRKSLGALSSDQRGLVARERFSVDGNFEANGIQCGVGPASGTNVDTIFAIRTSNNVNFLKFERYNTAGAILATDGELLSLSDGRLLFRPRSYIEISDPANVLFATVNSLGVDVPTGLYYSVNGQKVVGARGAAVADAAGGSVIDVEARVALNALLARLRVATGHGLIS